MPTSRKQPEAVKEPRKSHGEEFQVRIYFLNSIAAALGVAGFVFVASVPAAAQSAAKPAGSQSAIPRLSNGKPDLSGIWDKPRVVDVSKNSTGSVCGSLTIGCKQEGPGELPFTPAGLAKYNRRDEEAIEFDSAAYCWPEGYVRSWGTSFPVEIFQNPSRMAVLFEEYNVYHVIPTDGREHAKDLEPSWFGNSIGKWEGDTLVVDNIGFNAKTWIDTARHPHSEQLHTVERFDRPDMQHLNYEVTIEDPVMFTHPFKNKRLFVHMKPGQELMESVCEENNKDVTEHHVK